MFEEEVGFLQALSQIDEIVQVFVGVVVDKFMGCYNYTQVFYLFY